METIEKQILEMILPEGILEWFDVTSGKKTGEKMYIFLTEKNIPPITEKHRGKKVVCGGFTDIAVQDFPIRGKRVELRLLVISSIIADRPFSQFLLIPHGKHKI